MNGPGLHASIKFILFVRFSAVLSLSRNNDVLPASSRRQCPAVRATDSKQDDFRDIAEIESWTATIRTTILSHLVPDQVGLAGKSHRSMVSKPYGSSAFGTHRYRCAQSAMMSATGQPPYALEGHGRVARPAPPSIRGSNLLIWAVEAPQDAPLPKAAKISWRSSHRVMITPTLIARKSKRSRKLSSPCHGTASIWDTLRTWPHT